MRLTNLIAIVMLAAACRGKEPAQQQTMPSMGGMTMRSDSLTPIMRGHLDSLATMPPQVVAGMLRSHEAMASQMLDAMGSDMTMMGVHPDAAWSALADSVKRDLVELPSLSGRALETTARVHVERMRRLLGMHETMMKGKGGK
jgi:hypothetical protein